ncbi:MAG TPA: SAM-dependent methyltransferase [Gammaproteobacteria bacterium]|nr:SAM-dependent methyltransferase [Gammaproteobacteria bacterium]
MHNLSSPSPETVVHSQRVSALIRKTINEAGGAIPFNQFMEQALYAPGLGYYSAGLQKLGVSGDFITAPEISPLFSHCVARQCQEVLATFEEGVILELGAGSGIMAAEILKELERLACLPKHYFILEVSADLQQRQRATLQAQVPNHLHCVQWLDSLPSEPLQGVILANEVLDAMPVQRFRLEEQDVSECYVSLNEFNEESLTESPYVWQYLPTRDASLRAAVEALRPNLPIGYVSEMNLTLPAWIQAIAESLAAGLVLLIDYGFPSHEYYHPQRDQGTLMCHYQHQAHDNPLILIGIQDITAHVDFTAVGEAAESAHLQVSGYSNQANFLLACGLPEMLSSLNYNDTQYYLQQTQQAKTLILPSEMGELFKVMALTRHWEQPLLGFSEK